MTASCPNCETTGLLGTACASPTCLQRRLHLIPEADARRNKSATAHEPLIGTYIGEFLITRVLDKGGGFGRILLGLQRPLFAMSAAVKLLFLDKHDPTLRKVVLEKFENEARVLAQVRHDHVVRLLQYGICAGDVPFLAMEYIPGARTLGTETGLRALRGERIETPVLRRIIEQLGKALDHVHRKGLIHRDLKPDNIMLEEIDGDPWHVKLVDFGLAKSVADSPDTQFIVGTPAYMAPEQLERSGLGPTTDLYALGVICLELLVGRRLRAISAADIRSGKLDLDDAFAPATRLAEIELTPTETHFFARALARHPGDRFQSGAELCASFDDVLHSSESTLIRRHDLSGLIEPEEVSRLRREAARLESERQALVSEVRRLEQENRRISSIPPPLPDERRARRKRSIAVWIGAGAAIVIGATAAFVVTQLSSGDVQASRLEAPTTRVGDAAPVGAHLSADASDEAPPDASDDAEDAAPDVGPDASPRPETTRPPGVAKPRPETRAPRSERKPGSRPPKSRARPDPILDLPIPEGRQETP